VPVTNLDTIAGVGQLKAGFVSKAANYTVVAADTGTGIEAAADDKDAINTAATDRVGDSLTLVGDGVDGWYVVGVTGTWARET
jgi:hypothetical protein